MGVKFKMLKLLSEFGRGKELDTVGVAGSIPVEPTIQTITESKKLREIGEIQESPQFPDSPRRSQSIPTNPIRRGKKGANESCLDGLTSLPCFCPNHPVRLVVVR